MISETAGFSGAAAVSALLTVTALAGDVSADTGSGGNGNTLGAIALVVLAVAVFGCAALYHRSRNGKE
ncbi:MAG: hypothetical protein Q4Q62_02490 [Thermoplasmata archaeon]|nr:hypothetical protein [Thermoplasmata archaeon]